MVTSILTKGLSLHTNETTIKKKENDESSKNVLGKKFFKPVLHESTVTHVHVRKQNELETTRTLFQRTVTKSLNLLKVNNQEVIKKIG